MWSTKKWTFLKKTSFVFLLICSYISHSEGKPEYLPENHVIQQQALNFEFTLSEKKWQLADIGTYSDGSADLELSGYDDTASIVIFEHTDTDDIGGLTLWRIQNAHNAMHRANCSESRRFLQNSVYISVLVFCDGRAYDQSQLIAHHFIQTDEKRFIEMFVQYSANKSDMQRNKQKILETTFSLRDINSVVPL